MKIMKIMKIITILLFVIVIGFMCSCKTIEGQDPANSDISSSLASAAYDVQQASSDITKVTKNVNLSVAIIKLNTTDIDSAISTARELNLIPDIKKQLDLIDKKNLSIRDTASEMSAQMLVADRISDSSAKAFQIVSQYSKALVDLQKKVDNLTSENEKIRSGAIEEIYKYVKWFFGIGILICLGGAVVGYLVDKRLGFLLGGIGILSLTLALGITYYMKYIALAGTVILGIGVLTTLGILAWMTLKEKKTRTNLAGVAEQTVQLVEEIKKDLPDETKEKFFGINGVAEKTQNDITKKIVKKIKSGSKTALDPYRI